MLPAVAAALGVGRGSPRLRLPPVTGAAVLLVDGLGSEALAAHAEHAPFLTSLLAAGRRLTAGFPSTTATSLSSFGTGMAPGGHGIVGLEVLVPDRDAVMNSLTWDGGPSPEDWQPERTVPERLVAGGLPVHCVGPGAFDGSGLTRAALRGGTWVAAETVGERVAAVLARLRRSQGLVYGYHGDLDATGHRCGVDSAAWRHELAQVDRMVEQLAAGLPPGTALWVTGDHGMVDVVDRLDLAGEPDLDRGVRHLAGEPRARHVHAEPGAAADVLARWEERLGDRMWVRSGDEAVAAGWFGPVTARVRRRVGDIVAAARGTFGLVDSRRMPPAIMALVGMHGSLSSAELGVPLLEVRADALG